jgi:hypothetical protein
MLGARSSAIGGQKKTLTLALVLLHLQAIKKPAGAETPTGLFGDELDELLPFSPGYHRGLP